MCQDEGACVLISRGGKNSKKFTTMNLRNHLKGKHPKQFLELTAIDIEDRTVADKRKEDTNDSTTIRKKLKTQMSLQQSLLKQVERGISSAPAQKITKLISEMIVLDNQPFVMVEDLGFVRLMNHVAPRYHIPDQRHFSGTVIPNLVTKTEAAVSKLLKEVDHVSFTSDIWTCSHNNDTFISLSAH